MGKPRNGYTFEFKVGNKFKHRGITKNPQRRETEHEKTLINRGT